MATGRSFTRRILSSGGSIVVEITSPTPSEVITTSAPGIEWTFTPGTQSTYRVRLYDADMNQIYTTGTVVSSAQVAQIPGGVLANNQTYFVRVEVTTTDGAVGISSDVEFSTNIAPSTDVTGVTVAAIGGCGSDPTQLPGLRIRWDAVDPDPGETPLAYWVCRRTSPAEEWQRIVSISWYLGVTEYTDFAVNSGTMYQYAVEWTALVGSDSLVSNPQDPPPVGVVFFDWSYLHDQYAPTNYIVLPTWDVDARYEMQVDFERPWGRSKPTAYVGPQAAYSFTVNVEPIALRRPTWFNNLMALVDRQRNDDAILCLRLGEARMRAFVIATDPQRSIRLGGAGQTIKFQEVYFDEEAQS